MSSPKSWSMSFRMDPKPAAPTTADDPKALLERAVAAHQGGRFDEAQALYLSVLEAAPQDVNALTNLATLALQAGRLEEGLQRIDASLAMRPNQAHAWSNRANALTSLGRFDEALAACERALALGADNPDALNNQGNALQGLQRPDEALAAYRRAGALAPEFAPAHNNAGNLLQKLGRLDEAVAAYDAAIAGQPRFADAHNNRGVALQALDRRDEALAAYDAALAVAPGHVEAHNNRGIVLLGMGRYAEAGAAFDQVIAANPAYAPALNHKGVALQGLGRAEEALAAHQRALALDPNLADVHANTGDVLRALGRPDDAGAAYGRAIALDPGHAKALNGLGVSHYERLDFDAARAAFDRSIAVAPAYADPRWNKAVLCLTQEDYEEGLPLYEWRSKVAGLGEPLLKAFDAPLWLGDAPIDGKTILIHAEQGFGDTVQMLRYVPLLADRGATVILCVQPQLTELAATVRGAHRIITTADSLPDYDLHCPMMSLPLAFGTRAGAVPASVPYLAAPERHQAWWRKALGPATRRRIGLAWSGSATHKNDHNRTLALQALAPVLEADAEFISLQVEYRPADRALLAADGRIRNYQHDIKSFTDTAALIEQLDLVISVDTSVAHLAGALGKPLWALLSRMPDYRWALGRSDSPWYPSARLFRQPMAGDWASVVEEVASALGL